MTAQECYRCGARPDAGYDWPRFTLRTLPGPVTARRVAAVTRETDADVCPACLASPWGAVLAELADDPGARTIRDRGRCRIECAQHARRRRTIARHFRRETVSCPVCFRLAEVQHADRPAPPTIGDQLATRYTARTGRPWPRVTAWAVTLLLVAGPLLAPVWGAWAVAVPVAVVLILVLAHYALTGHPDQAAPGPDITAPADPAAGVTAADPAGPVDPSDADQLAAQLADARAELADRDRELADARSSETAALGRLAVLSGPAGSGRAANGDEDQADEHETTVDRWAS